MRVGHAQAAAQAGPGVVQAPASRPVTVGAGVGVPQPGPGPVADASAPLPPQAGTDGWMPPESPAETTQALGTAHARQAARVAQEHAHARALAHAAAQAQIQAQVLAAQAAQEDRTAEIAAQVAAAEDFDPLRLRPYVTLEDEEAGAPVTGAGPLPPLAPVTAPAGGADATEQEPARHRAPRRPAKAFAFGVTAVAVLGTAAFATGLFTGDGRADDTLADATHAGMPDIPSPGHKPADGATPSAQAPHTIAHAASPSPSASHPATSKTVRPAAAHSEEVTTESAPRTQGQGAAGGGQAAHDDGTLRPGDSGPDVAALQSKLAALHLYHGAITGRYDENTAASVRIFQMYRHVTGDPAGVYGPHTRAALASTPAAPTQVSRTTRTAHRTTEHHGYRH